MKFELSPGNSADISVAKSLVEGIPFLSRVSRIAMDKGYDANWLVELLEEYGIEAVIPPRSNRKNPRPYDKEVYKHRNVVERMFAQAKEFRRIATRYDKLADSYVSFLCLVFVYICLRYS